MSENGSGKPLVDVQMEKPAVALAIDRVGVRDVVLPLRVQDRAEGSQRTVARAALAVDLPDFLRGTHMSRLMGELESFDEVLTHASARRLLGRVRVGLCASRAAARFAFPFLLLKKAPATGLPGRVACDCALLARLDDSGQSLAFEVEVPVMTVCPCSLAISSIGAHSQRALTRIRCGVEGMVWLEELIEFAEESSSCPVHTLLKREDEKLVTERAFANPMFVEDAARACARRLLDHPQISWFRVTVESIESIHPHNAFACVEHGEGWVF